MAVVLVASSHRQTLLPGVAQTPAREATATRKAAAAVALEETAVAMALAVATALVVVAATAPAVVATTAQVAPATTRGGSGGGYHQNNGGGGYHGGGGGGHYHQNTSAPGGPDTGSDDDLVRTPGSSVASPVSSSATPATTDPAGSGAAVASGSSGSLLQLDVAIAGSSVPATPPVPTPPCTRLQDGTIQPVNYKTKYGLVSSVSTGEPRTVAEALADPKWRMAMEEEFHALQKNHTCHLVASRPGRNVIDCKWVY